jgi:hypothetical protein
MSALRDRFGVKWEAYYPLVLGMIGGLIAYVVGPQLMKSIEAKQWEIENLFVAIFTLGTVTAGFGVAIYTFLLTTETGFIGIAKRTIYYRHLLTYVLIATFLSAVTAVLSIPGMLIKSAPEVGSFHAFYVAVWSGVSIWTGASLFRAGHIFSIFAAEHH